MAPNRNETSDPWATACGDDEAERASGGGTPPATARRRERGVPPSSGTSSVLGSTPDRPDRNDLTPPPGPPPGEPPRREEVDVVGAMLPVELAAEQEEEAERALGARRDRELGGPVRPEAGDEAAVIRLKGRLARLHLRALDEGVHERALGVLDEIAGGRVKAPHVTKDGDVVEVDLHPSHRIAAARGILGHAASLYRVNGGQMKIENAQVVAAGDLIAQVDPERLRRAIERIRSRRKEV